MDVIAINASPRKTMNTSSLLNAVNEEVATCGKSIRIYSLYEMNFKGCFSCFACKKENTKSYGKCPIKDDLFSVFEEIRNCSALILATPIYFGDVAGQLRCFLERFLFQNMIYSTPPRSLFGKRINVGMIYTMNIQETQYQNYSLKPQIEAMEGIIKRIIGDTKSFFAFGTNQLNDYSGIEYTYINGQERLKNHKENFSKEIKRVKDFARSLI